MESTEEQNLACQVDALLHYRCFPILFSIRHYIAAHGTWLNRICALVSFVCNVVHLVLV